MLAGHEPALRPHVDLVNFEPAANGDARLATVGVHDHVVGEVFAGAVTAGFG